MKTYTINNIPFEYDDTLSYMDFFVREGKGHLVDVNWDFLFSGLQCGKFSLAGVEYDLIMMDRWLLDVPRKRIYRKMVLEGIPVLSDEFWFEEESDEEAEKIFEGLTNSGRLARKFLETFFPKVAEQCKSKNHPAQQHYIDP